MNFAPYHNFLACQRLEEAVQDIRDRGAIPEAVCVGYDKYHYSLLHKLRSARYHVDNLREYLEAQATATHHVSALELVYQVNFHFDGFTHSVGSALDIFAREVLTYFGVPLPGQVYFEIAERSLRELRPGDAVLQLLASPAWRAEFADYRNTATHESVVGTQYQMMVSVEGDVETRWLVFPLPDDPRSNERTYRRNPDIVEYCRMTFVRLLRFLNQAYDHLATRIHDLGTLPL